MAGIANCDNVIIVLTSEYVKSLNCMLEMAYLVSQDDWDMKAMVLVVDESLYSLDRKIEVINYWLLYRKRVINETEEVGKSLYEEEREYLDLICSKIEIFFQGISRRKNPSQIAIVNEVIKKSKRDKRQEQELVSNGERVMREILKKNGQLSISDISKSTGLSRETVQRHISNLMEKGVIERTGRSRYYIYKQ